MRAFICNLLQRTSLRARLSWFFAFLITLLASISVFIYVAHYNQTRMAFVQIVAEKNIQLLARHAQEKEYTPSELQVEFNKILQADPDIYHISLAQDGKELFHLTAKNRTFETPPLPLVQPLPNTLNMKLKVVYDVDSIATALHQTFLPCHQVLWASLAVLLLGLGGVHFFTEALHQLVKKLLRLTDKKEIVAKVGAFEPRLIDECVQSLNASAEFHCEKLKQLNVHFEELIDAKTSSLKAEVAEKAETQKHLEVSNEEKTILLKEVHHRVKNNLAIIIGLIRMQSRRIKDSVIKSKFVDLQNRIKTMELIHTNLYATETFNKINMKHYLNSLSENLNNTFSKESESVTFFVRCEDLLLDIDQAITCGQITNELVTNAFKHAFKEGEEGHIWVTIEEEGGEIVLRVEDNGATVSLEPPKKFSLGLSLVYELTRYQLKGSVEVSHTEGLKYCIRFKK
jgi:two-component sensor histidine kinase